MEAEQTPVPLKPTRADFVRALPEAMSIEEVIERGREAGLEIEPAEVHAARYYMRQAAASSGTSKPVSVRERELAKATPEHPSSGTLATAAKTARRPRRARGAHDESEPDAAPAEPVRARRAKRSGPDAGAQEDQLRSLIVRLGIERTLELIAELEAWKPG